MGSEFHGHMTETEKHYERLLAEVCRERERYNGMHQIAVMEIDRLRASLEEILDYTGGAANALDDEYVIDRARAALNRLASPATDDGGRG